MSFCMLQNALQVPGGNQVDGLPPARHTETRGPARAYSMVQGVQPAARVNG